MQTNLHRGVTHVFKQLGCSTHGTLQVWDLVLTLCWTCEDARSLHMLSGPCASHGRPCARRRALIYIVYSRPIYLNRTLSWDKTRGVDRYVLPRIFACLSLFFSLALSLSLFLSVCGGLSASLSVCVFFVLLSRTRALAPVRQTAANFLTPARQSSSKVKPATCGDLSSKWQTYSMSKKKIFVLLKKTISLLCKRGMCTSRNFSCTRRLASSLKKKIVFCAIERFSSSTKSHETNSLRSGNLKPGFLLVNLDFLGLDRKSQKNYDFRWIWDVRRCTGGKTRL